MDLQRYFTFVAAFIFVLALIFALAWIAKRLGVGGAVASAGRGRRLALVEVLALDAKRRLAIVRRDDVEHLILLGPSNDTLIESGIQRPSFGAAVAAVGRGEAEATK